MIELIEGENNLDLIVKKIYNYILNGKDYYTFINLLSEKYNINKKQITISLKEYINTLSKEEQKKYKENKKKIDQKIKSEQEKNKCKYYFYLYLNQKSIKNKNLNKSKIKEYSKIYFEKYATKEEKEKYQQNIQQNNKKELILKDLKMFEKLLLNEQPLKIINDSDIKSYKELSKKTNQYIKFLKEKSKLNEQQINLTKIKLNEILQEYKIKKQEEYQQQISLKAREKSIKEVDSLPLAETFVAKIINSDINGLNSFCDDNNISKKDLKKYIDIVKRLNPIMYKEYQIKAKEINHYKQEELIKQSRKIVNLMNIDFIKKKKDFSIVDYYLITQISPKRLYDLTKEYLTSEEKFLFLNFCNDNNNLHEIKIKDILKKDILINNRSLTLKEKNILINYMQINKLPLYEEIFKILAYKNFNQTKEEENVTNKSTRRI